MISSRLGASLIASVLVVGAKETGQSPAPPPSLEAAFRTNNLGVALLEQFKFDEAATAFREALRREPNLGIAHLNLGIALLQSSDLEAARTEAATAERLMPRA